MPPSSALSLPVSAAPARQLSRANRPRKRKSSAGELLLCSPAAYANALHKTDGSHTNRPFLCPKQGVRESVFSQIDQLSRSVFCFFSSRKEIVPLLFFLEEKKQKKIICGTVTSLRSCRFRQRAAQNGRFKCEPSVFLFRAGHAGKHLFTDKSTAPQCLLFLFFKKRNRSPSFLFRRKEAKENHLRNSYLPALLPLSPTCCTKRTVQMRTVRFFVPGRTRRKASIHR